MSQVRRREGPLSPATVKALVADLNAHFGNKIATATAVREHHGHTMTWIADAPPDAVVFAEIDRGSRRRRAHLRRGTTRRSSRSAPAPRSKAMSTRCRAASRIDMSRR